MPYDYIQFPGTVGGPNDPRVIEEQWRHWPGFGGLYQGGYSKRGFYKILEDWAAGRNIPSNLDTNRIQLLMDFIGRHPLGNPDLKGRVIKQLWNKLPRGGQRTTPSGQIEYGPARTEEATYPDWFTELYPRLLGQQHPEGGWRGPDPLMALEAITTLGGRGPTQWGRTKSSASLEDLVRRDLWGQAVGQPLTDLLRTGGNISGPDVTDWGRWKSIPTGSWTGWSEGQKQIAPSLLDSLQKISDYMGQRRLIAARKKRAMGGGEDGRDFGGLVDALTEGFGLFPGMKTILPQMVYGAFNTLMTPPAEGVGGQAPGGMGGGSLEQILRELLGGMGGQGGGMDWWEMMRGLLGSPYGYAGGGY